MLTLNFHIEPADLSQRAFKFHDMTGDYDQVLNPGGYGDPNIKRSDVNFVVLWVTWPDGSMTRNEIPYKPMGYEIELLASTLAPQVASMVGDYAVGPASDIYGFVNKYPDGVYDMIYEIWGGVLPNGFLANYSASGKFAEGARLWVKKQGGWYDMTDVVDYSYSAGNRVGFSALFSNSAEEYGFWQVRDQDDKLIFSGGFEVEVIGASGSAMVTSINSYLMGACAKRFALIGNTLMAMDEISTRLLDMDDTDPNVILRINKTAMCLSQIDILEMDPIRTRAKKIFPWVSNLIPCLTC